MEKGYYEKMRKQILSPREYYRNDLLEREKPPMYEKKLTFNISYYPAFQNVRNIMGDNISYYPAFQNVRNIMEDNISYYPAFQNVRNIMEGLHILLTPIKEHKKVFT